MSRDARWWSLYDGGRSASAAKALNAAVDKTMASFVRRFDPKLVEEIGLTAPTSRMVNGLAEIAEIYFSVVMNRYAKDGAMDTEPRGCARDALAQEVAKAYHWDVKAVRSAISGEVL